MRSAALLIALWLAAVGGASKMPLHELFADDYTGYANQTAFENAYPYNPAIGGSGTSAVTANWGATNGPDSQPGVLTPETVHTSTGFFDKFPLAPAGHLFRIKGRWKPDSFFTGGYDLVTQWWAPAADRDSDFAGNIVQLQITPTSGNLSITVRTATGFGNLVSPPRQNTVLSAALPAGTAADVQIDGQISTLVESPPGTFTPNADGFVTVSIGGVQVFSFTGPVWNGRTDLGPSDQWSGVTIGPDGRFTNLEIWDEIAGTIPTNNSTPCCGDTVTPSTGGSTTGAALGQNPNVTLPAWTRGCMGGGTVPTAADPVDSEDWSV